MSEIKNRIREVARVSRLTERASVADFLSWRAEDRITEAGTP